MRKIESKMNNSPVQKMLDCLKTIDKVVAPNTCPFLSNKSTRGKNTTVQAFSDLTNSLVL